MPELVRHSIFRKISHFRRHLPEGATRRWRVALFGGAGGAAPAAAAAGAGIVVPVMAPIEAANSALIGHALCFRLILGAFARIGRIATPDLGDFGGA
jgi:hypothetical protein